MTIQLPITSVTVHPDGATVVRHGSATVQDGHVRIHQLPLLLEPTSLRVAVRGGTLGQTRLDLDLPYAHRAEEQAERAELAQKRAELGVVEAEIHGLQRTRKLLGRDAFTIDSKRPAPTAALLQSWRQLGQAVEEWIGRLDARDRELSRQSEALQQSIGTLEANLAERSTEAIWRRWAPTRLLDLTVAGETVSIEVSYTIPGARWTPAYGIDLAGDLARGRFVMRALVAQATGEDWGEVALRLSTAPRSRIVDLPELHALRLGTVQPPRPTGWRPLPADLDDLFPTEPPPPVAQKPDTVTLEADKAWSDDEGDADELLTFPEEPTGEGVPMPSPASMAKSAPGMFGGSSQSSAPTAPPAMMRSRGAPPAPQEARARKAGKRPQRPQGPRRHGVQVDQLDYARLRVLGPDAARGRRGRLKPLPEVRLFAERGLPDQAWSRWSRAMRQLIEDTHLLEQRPMPPHHRVPGPVDDIDVAWDLDGRVDVPSDGRFHTTNVFTTDAMVRLSYRAVPRADTRVFRRLTAEVPRIGALPPGPLEASIEGSLEITAPFDGQAGDAAISFGLGAEDGLTLVRNVRYDEESSGFFGGGRIFRTAIQVEVASALSREVRIEILERVPVPMKVDQPAFSVTEASPPAEPYQGDAERAILKGGRCQQLTVPAGGKATARLTYQVELSNKEELAGGDRRG